MSETGSYLYAIARGLGSDDLSGVTGLRGAPLRVVEHRGLAAIVSSVDLDEFGDEGLRRNLESLSWLEDVARTHDDVVHAAAAKAPTAPLRLATICLDDDNVRARLDDWHDALERTLGRIEGRMEWSVKAFASPAGEAESPASTETADVGAGAAYLMRRKAANAQREEAAEAAVALADELHAALSLYCVASRRLPPQDKRLTGHEATMTLNGAYLVDDAGADKFRDAAQALSEEHPDARMEIHGPWPPYSFATLDEP